MSPAIEAGFDELFEDDRILCGLRADSKIVVLNRLAGLLRQAPAVQHPESGIIDGFVQRERLGSTIIDTENGIALPHVLLKGVSYPSAALAILARPITFDEDGNKARIVIGLALPAKLPGSQRQLLEHIRRFFGDPERCRTLAKAERATEVIAFIHSYAHAA